MSHRSQFVLFYHVKCSKNIIFFPICSTLKLTTRKHRMPMITFGNFFICRRCWTILLFFLFRHRFIQTWISRIIWELCMKRRKHTIFEPIPTTFIRWLVLSIWFIFLFEAAASLIQPKSRNIDYQRETIPKTYTQVYDGHTQFLCSLLRVSQSTVYNSQVIHTEKYIEFKRWERDIYTYMYADTACMRVYAWCDKQ